MIPKLRADIVDAAERAAVDVILAEQRRANVCADPFAVLLGQRQVVPPRRWLIAGSGLRLRSGRT